jgi:hypothetical protein
MMIDNGFGATFKVAIGLPSTVQDDFKRAMVDSVRLTYPHLSLDEETEIPHGNRYVRPDLIVRLPGTETVVLVADAKCRGKIELRDVMKMVKYKATMRASRAALYHPANAHVTAGARQAAGLNDVDLVAA